MLGGEAENINHLESRRTGRVLNAHSDAESAGVQFMLQALFDSADLLGCSVLVGRRAALWQNFLNARVRPDIPRVQRRTEDQRPRRYMARSGAVVNERLAFFGLKKLCNVRDADFHFESVCNPVESLYSLAREFLAMLMQIDESRSNNQSGRINDTSSR